MRGCTRKNELAEISEDTMASHEDPGSPNRGKRRNAPPPTPAHLSEFLSYVNGTAAESKDDPDTHTPPPPPSLDAADGDIKKSLGRKKRSNITAGSNSSTMAWSIGSDLSNASMTPTTMDLDVLIGKADVHESLANFTELEKVSRELCQGLRSVSELFGRFGSVAEKISRSKGSGEHCDLLSTFSNYQYLVSNQHRYLGEMIERDFGAFLHGIKTDYSTVQQERQAVFDREYRDLARQLKATEKLESKLRRGRTRNLIVYKNNLNNLNNKLDEIDRVYHDYYVDSFHMLEDAHGAILEHAKSVVGQEAVVFGKLAEKTHPGNGLDGLVKPCDFHRVVEPASEAPGQADDAHPQQRGSSNSHSDDDEDDEGDGDDAEGDLTATGDTDTMKGAESMREPSPAQQDELYMEHAVGLLHGIESTGDLADALEEMEVHD